MNQHSRSSFVPIIRRAIDRKMALLTAVIAVVTFYRWLSPFLGYLLLASVTLFVLSFILFYFEYKNPDHPVSYLGFLKNMFVITCIVFTFWGYRQFDADLDLQKRERVYQQTLLHEQRTDRIYQMQSNIKVVDPHILSKAASGDPDYQAALFRLYSTPGYDFLDYQEANKWGILAAEQDHPVALFLLGRRMYMSIGIEKDVKTAVAFVKRAAELEYIFAQNWLGMQMQKGEIGRVTDCEKWFLRTAKRGHSLGIESLITYYREYQPRKAEMWLKQLAEKGNAQAQAEYSMLCTQKGNYTQADYWLGEALKQGELLAYTAEAKLLLKDPAKRNLRESGKPESLLNFAASGGSVEAMYLLLELCQKKEDNQGVHHWSQKIDSILQEKDTKLQYTRQLIKKYRNEE